MTDTGPEDQTSQYTRGSQVLTAADVEYLFRAIKTDITAIQNRLRGLQRHYDPAVSLANKQDIGYPLQEAYNMLMACSAKVAEAEKRALKKEFPHRGEW